MKTTELDNTIHHATSIALCMLAPSNTGMMPNHKAIIRGTCEALLRAAFGELDTRVITGCPTGAGKSTCVAACIFALHEMGHLQEHPVMVLAEQIAAGEELADLLIEGYGARTLRPSDKDTGLDPRLIAHVHGDVGGDDPEDADYAPAVIATHKRSRMTKDVCRMLRYEGIDRGTWIDEGMLASSAFGLTVRRAVDALSRISGDAKTHRATREHQRQREAKYKKNRGEFDEAAKQKETVTEAEREALALQIWADRAADALSTACGELKRLSDLKDMRKENGDVLVAVALPEPTDFDLDQALKLVQAARVSDHADRILEAAKASPESFTLIGRGTQHAILQHRRVLPKEMDTNTVVLDAGAEVDAIQRADPGLKSVERQPWWPRDEDDGQPIPAAELKSWEDVTLYHMNAKGGRSSVDGLRGYLADLAASTAELIEEHANAGDEILVCTYASCEDRLERFLRKALKKQKKFPVAIGGDTKPSDEYVWVHVIHYGQHHSTNRYQNARIVVGLGDYPISREDLKALIIGQRNTLRSADNIDRYVPSKDKVTAGMGRWCAKGAVQLAGRGRSRQVVNGKAREMIFAFVTDRPETVRALHEVAMPGAALKEWAPPQSVIDKREAALAALAGANAARSADGAPRQAFDFILPRLEKFRDAGGESVSSRSIRQQLNLPGTDSWLTAKAMQRGLDLLVAEVEWIEFVVGADGERSNRRTLTLLPDLPF